MKEPLVSVVIPAYNCAKYISCSIDSVLNQEVDLEIIVIDDCSSDSLDEVMEKYAADIRVKYHKNSKNLGAAESRNLGVSMAKGKYIAFLDADDIWVDNKLKKQIEAMENSDAVLCATARELIDVNGNSMGRVIPVEKVITYNDLLKHNSISCSSVLIKNEAAREFPMHDDDCHEDYIMWLEVLKKYKFACGINEPLLKYRLSNDGKSGNKLKSAKMTFIVYRKIGLSIPRAVLCFISYAFNGVKKYFG